MHPASDIGARGAHRGPVAPRGVHLDDERLAVGTLLILNPKLVWFTTGVSHTSDVKCSSALALVEELAGAVAADEENGELVELEDGAESVLRHFSASGRCVWTPARTARR